MYFLDEFLNEKTHSGDELLENIFMFNLCLLNQGNDPTFIARNRREVIDIAWDILYVIQNVPCI